MDPELLLEGSFLFYLETCLLSIINTNLDEQSSWASFTRRFRDMDI